MIKIQPIFPPSGDRRPSPLVMGIARSLSPIYDPLLEKDLPANLANLVRRLGHDDKAD